ncbi:hypothetical protein ACE193_05880 [Bernardetia sp. OM2101]|uniref:hypothetical protein n=1 Tax=Bernardetia sp. OM2101 TaxID=3344876 RepID=UPI0035D04417
MKNLLLTLFLLFNIQFSATACLNYFYGVDKDGHTHEATYIMETFFYENFNSQKHFSSLKKSIKNLEKKHSYKYLSDYSIALMKLGKADIALELLKALNYHYPNDYKITANLGTAYELNSELDSALKYIKKGLELNPNSHRESEWVHVKILEAKKKIKQNPSYLTKNSILQLSEKQKNDKKTYEQINIQLRERFPFSPPPNEIMAHLIMEFAECATNIESVEYANALYNLVNKYYEYNSEYLQTRIKETKGLKMKYANKEIENPVKTVDHSDHFKMTYLTYKQFLQKFPMQKINWSKINTNVDSLLNLVDFEQIPKRIKASNSIKVEPQIVEKKGTTEKITKIEFNEPHEAIKEKFIPREVDYNSLLLVGAFAIAIIFLVVYLKKRKN